ncbi:MAG TPA: glycerol-3-phosphate dehydrogenase/oxidase [Tepidisphaeraceae bacterium]|jgi:glycerol-3-phosphate dehydrogenase|nr:glycerol-3-phosphate dehydrogenase/oxidase [Tepidisphaeraceae bacterium]
MLSREETINSLMRSPLDVLVIGGGIVGAGVARDAAMRGLRVALVEKADFASGTSSRSSRLLHGGIRYLAQGRIGLVREASKEKVVIHNIAPHLAIPLPFTFPTRKGTEWKLWKLRIGVKLYDLLCGGRNLGKSSWSKPAKLARTLPGLSQQNLTGAVRYFDGMTNDARLVIDTLRSAERAGAMLANFTSVEDIDRAGDHWQCRLNDHVGDRRFSVTAKTVVNAAGAWADKFRAARVQLRLTKGVHLVIDRSRLPVDDAVVMTEGSRILFAIPWGERVILGTTDTDYDGNIDNPLADESDIQYILDVTNETFPTAHISTDDVISWWAGLRPLIADPNRKPSDISRAHQISMTEPGWIDVAGGKLTTYRLMAEQTVDRVIDFAKLDARKCETERTPLLEQPAKYSGITPPPVSREAVAHFIENEWALHLTDVMIRRSSWRYYYRNHLEIAEQVAGWMKEFLGWDDETFSEELDTYRGLTSSGRGEDAREFRKIANETKVNT